MDEMNREVSFWNFNVGHLLTIVLLGISVVGLYFKFDARLAAVELLAASTRTRVEQMDEVGTRRSQMGLFQDQEAVRANTNRVSAVEKQVYDMAPKLERIDVNVQWMMGRNGADAVKPKEIK